MGRPRVRSRIQKAVVGQDVVIERLLVALVADGHVLIEEMPGLAKTLLVKERNMMRRWGQITQQPQITPVSSAEERMALRVCVDKVHVSEELQRHMLALVRATRSLAVCDLAEGQGEKQHVPLSALSFGASPRATLALLQAGRALAFVRGQDFATPEPVQEIVLDAARHWVGLTYEAEAERITADDVLRRGLEVTPLPEKV